MAASVRVVVAASTHIGRPRCRKLIGHFVEKPPLKRRRRRFQSFQGKRNALASSPPPKPVSLPFEPMTRWQGTTIDTGFRPFAAPTARIAPGLPICFAMSPYDRVSPNGIVRSASQPCVERACHRRPASARIPSDVPKNTHSTGARSPSGPDDCRRASRRAIGRGCGQSFSHRMPASPSSVATSVSVPTGEFIV